MIFVLDDDSSPETSNAVHDLGLSDCKYIPHLVEFPNQDPLGKKTVEINYSELLKADSEDDFMDCSLMKPLGVQANSLKEKDARLYALERVARACQIIVSKQIVFAILDSLVKTLSFDEISSALNDLGVDNVQSLVDFMKMFSNDSGCGFAQSEANGAPQRQTSGWKVMCVAVKVFLCQSEKSMNDVAKYCSDALLREAKGEFSGYLARNILDCLVLFSYSIKGCT